MATYQQLFNLCKKKFNISWLYGQSHANEKLFLTEKAKQYPTLCVGFLNIIHPDRLHIIGPAEIEFFNQISHDARIGSGRHDSTADRYQSAGLRDLRAAGKGFDICPSQYR